RLPRAGTALTPAQGRRERQPGSAWKNVRKIPCTTASAGEDKKVCMWKIGTISALWSMTLAATPDDMAFSPAGWLLAVCSDGKLVLFAAGTGAESDTRVAAKPIRAAAFQRHYRRCLAYGTDSGEITTELNGPAEKKTLMAAPGVRWLAFEPAGRL